jgi:hypothetical protein
VQGGKLLEGGMAQGRHALILVEADVSLKRINFS